MREVISWKEEDSMIKCLSVKGDEDPEKSL